MKNELVELNELTISDDIYIIENNYVAAEKIYDDIYSNITEKELEDLDINIDKFGSSSVIRIYKGSRSIKTIVNDNKYHILVAKNGRIIAVLKINNINNKIIEFVKLENDMYTSFDAASFLTNNSFIITIKEKNICK